MRRAAAARRARSSCCVAVTGCGDDGRSAGPDRGADATLVLDFRPNAVHAGIELAVDRGFDEAEGVTLHVQPPSSSADAVKLLVNGRADLAVLDLHDLALARSQGPRPGRRHGARPAAAGRRPGPAGRPPPARPLGRPRRRHGRAQRRGRPARDRRWRRRRREVRARGDDRLRRGRRAPRPPRGRGHRVLERRGRAAAPPPPALARLPARGLRRAALPGARPVRHPPDARRAPRDGPRDGPGPAPRLPGGAGRPRVGGHLARRPRRRRPRRGRARARRGQPRSSRPTAGRRALDRAVAAALGRLGGERGLVDQPPDVDRAFAFGF